MSRPAREDIDRTTANWVQRFNNNMAKAVDAPAPFVIAADAPTLTALFNPKLYKDCIAVVGSLLYKSDGTTWKTFREQLTYVADLDTGTATIEDVKNSHNSLLADMQSKGWMS